MATWRGRTSLLNFEERMETSSNFRLVVSVPAAFDVLAGARYWYQQADVTLDIAGTLDIADLVVLGRNRAIAKSGSVDWTDPFVGGRLRVAVAPGHELFIRGDVGGFNVG